MEENMTKDYTLLIKKLLYAQHMDNADMYSEAKSEITTKCSNFNIKCMMAQAKVSIEIKKAGEKGIYDLFKKWEQELKENKLI